MKFKLLLILLIIGIIILYFIPAPKANFFKLYKKRDKASASLEEFYKEPTKHINVNGVDWKYYSGGNGQKTILFLHGMGGAYDLWWQQIMAFKHNYRIISYTLPDKINNLKDAKEGIEAILKQENVDKFYAIGTSMGGYITQYLVKTMPNRVEKAVFGNTFPPNDLLRKQNEVKSKIVRILPEYVISLFGKSSLKNKLLPAGENDSLLAAFLPSLPFSKKSFIGRYEIVTDYFMINPVKYKYKRIPKLIILSDNDPLIPLQLRREIVDLYPKADVFVFHNKGHFPYINEAQKYNEIIKNFLEKPDEYSNIENSLRLNYFEGRKNADLNRLKNIFDKNSGIFVKRKDSLFKINFDEYLGVVNQSGKSNVKTDILDVDVENDFANANVKFQYPDKTYIDYLNLIKQNDGWKIVNKISVLTNEKK